MAHPEEKANSHPMREMRSLGEAIDSLLNGDLERAGDILAQRFKALEVSTAPGGWNMGRHYEIIPPESVGLTSESERALAVRRELDRLRLVEAEAKSQQAKSAG